MDNDDLVILTGDDMSLSTLTYSTSYPSIDMNTVTIDSSSWNNFSITNSMYNTDASVSIDTNGINMKPDGDLKIGDRSLKEFMDRVEERLNILHPNPALENKWSELAELGKRYRELEAEILEKERVWKILKEE